MCDDVEKTVAELTGKGVEFTREIEEESYGLTIMMKVPGAGEIQLYQPKHLTVYDA
jgi:hypothetical protein